MPYIAKDFTPDKFPILIEALHYKTRAVVWSITVEMPTDYGGKVPVNIPHLSAIHGHPVAIRFTFGDGEVSTGEPVLLN